MAYSSQALSSLLRRKRQYEAAGGQLTSAETEGLTRGILSTEASRDIEMARQARNEALSKESLAIQRESVESQRDISQENLALQKKALSDQELAGYISTGATLLGSKAGGKVLGKVWPSVFGETTTPAITAGAAAPAISTAGAAAPSALTGATPYLSGTAIPALTEAGGGFGTAIGTQGFLPGGQLLATGAGEGATVGGMTLGGAVAPATAGAIGGAIGSYASKSQLFRGLSPFGGRRTESAFGGALGGAAGGYIMAGATIGGPVGALIGGVIGLGAGLLGAGPNPVWEIEKGYDELYDKTEKQFKSQYGETEGGAMYHAWKYGGTYSGSAGTQTFPQGGMKNKEGEEKDKIKEDSGGTVICTELYRQGFISSKELKYSTSYKKKVSDATYQGYYWWASKLVKLMKKSELVSKIVRPFGTRWAKEMMHRLKPDKFKSNFTGKILLGIGLPVSKFIGERRKRHGMGKSFANCSASSIK